MKLRWGWLLGAAVFAFACNGNDQQVGNQIGFDTEGGSVLALAPTVEYGETVAGSITGRQIDLWALDVKAGDKFTVTKTVSDGDLQPDFLLYLGAHAGHISSAQYQAGAGTLTKSYELSSNGRYVIAVRAYKNQGTGDYTLTIRCDGGPCAGEQPPPQTVELTNDQKARCMTKARLCAFDKMGVYNGAVGPARARELVTTCLAEVTLESWETDLPVSCVDACQGEDATAMCESLIAKLPWFADRSPECLVEWDTCMSDCYPSGSDSYYVYDDEIYYTPEGVCVHEALFNGNCWYYITDIEPCGGPVPIDTHESCMLYCQNTQGAWMDDLDTICDEECEYF